MSPKNTLKTFKLATAVSASIFLIILLSPFSCAQATNETGIVDLKDISGAIVTLYYYDEASGGKGKIVPMPDNPQVVSSDPSISPMGAYTFTKVPEGKYYLEAVNNGNAYFAIVEVNKGTSTANVAIPGWRRVNNTATGITPTPVIEKPTLTATPAPILTPSLKATPTPASNFIVASLILALSIVIMQVASKKL